MTTIIKTTALTLVAATLIAGSASAQGGHVSNQLNQGGFGHSGPKITATGSAQVGGLSTATLNGALISIGRYGWPRIRMPSAQLR